MSKPISDIFVSSSYCPLSLGWSFWLLISVQASLLIGVWQPSSVNYWPQQTVVYPIPQRSKHHEGWADGRKLPDPFAYLRAHFNMQAKATDEHFWELHGVTMIPCWSDSVWLTWDGRWGRGFRRRFGSRTSASRGRRSSAPDRKTDRTGEDK